MIARLFPALALLAAAPAPVSPAEPQVEPLQAADARVQALGWRLATANHAFCARTMAATGITLADLATYDDAAAAREAYHLPATGAIFVSAIAPGSPAQHAGLAVNTMLAAIAGHDLAGETPPSRGDWFARLTRVQALLDASAAQDGGVALRLADGHAITIPAQPACRVRYAVEDGKDWARAVRDEVHVGYKTVLQTGADDDLLAALLAHETAHAVLDHQAQILAAPHDIAVVRRTEREADRLSVWLLANAGFDPQAAVRLQAEVVRRRAGFLGFDPGHGSWRERAQVVTAEIATLRAAPDADWAHRFVREAR